MKTMKKLSFLFVAIFMICSLLCVNANADTTSNNETGVYRLMLLMQYHGGADQSLDRTKLNTYNYVNATPLAIATYNEGVYLQVRDSSTNASATADQFVESSLLSGTTTSWTPSYYSGYGVVNNDYYIKGHTSTADINSAAVDGYWRP